MVIVKQDVSQNNHHILSATSIRNGLVAGYAAGFCGTIVGHPLDSIKVLLQTNNGIRKGGVGFPSIINVSACKQSNSDTAITRAASQPSYSNVSSKYNQASKANVSTTATKATTHSPGAFYGKRSLRALYAGVTGPLISAGILQSLNFAIYDSLRRVLYQRQLQSGASPDIFNGAKSDDYLHFDSLFNVAVASFLTGATTSILTSPMVLVKTKQQIMVWGFREAVSETFYNKPQNEKHHFFQGIKNFYKGFGVHFFCDAFGRSVYLTCYEVLKRSIAKRNAGDYNWISHFDNTTATSNLSVAERMLCAATAGMICWVFIFPADVIRSRLYAQSISNNDQICAFDVARNMVKEQGLTSIYRGMGVTVARAGPVAAAVLPMYDYALAWISS